MKTSKKSVPTWLLVPPAVALLLLLGPLSMQSAAKSSDAPIPPQPTVPAAQPTDGMVIGRAAQRVPAAPKSISLLDISSSLAAVLVLGAVGIYVLRRVRGGVAPTGGSSLITLRQSVRLSAKQIVHALEFDDRIVLVGESERGLALLDKGRLPEPEADERSVAQRAEAPAEEGAVPKNLVIPRPPQKTVDLGNFRNLLEKAGR